MNESIALTESTYYILLSLYKPQHGYGIMQQTEELSGGRVRLAAGTLYGALNTMLDKGWILQLPIEDGSRQKKYELTDKGLKVLLGEIERLKELVKKDLTSKYKDSVLGILWSFFNPLLSMVVLTMVFSLIFAGYLPTLSGNL